MNTNEQKSAEHEVDSISLLAEKLTKVCDDVHHVDDGSMHFKIDGVWFVINASTSLGNAWLNVSHES